MFGGSTNSLCGACCSEIDSESGIHKIVGLGETLLRVEIGERAKVVLEKNALRVSGFSGLSIEICKDRMP